MRNFGVLYRYEIKKIAKRKITWIAFFITLVMSLMSVFSDVTGELYVDGVVYETYYQTMQKDRAYARALSGRAIDRELITEMVEAYKKVPVNVARYSLTEEYQTYARPYSEIFQFVRKTMGFSSLEEDLLAWEVDEEELYGRFRENIEVKYDSYFLTEGEKQYWQDRMQELEAPFVFGYAQGYWKLLSVSYTICFMAMFMVAVCLSDLFTKEHTFRTDQLLLSSRLGKRQIYWAKILAGMSLALISSMFIWLVAVMSAFGLYGTDGADVIVQFAYPAYPAPMRACLVVVIASVLMVLAILLTSAFVMMLSELLHNATATLAVSVCVIMIPLFAGVPYHHRIIAQIWSYLPTNLLDYNSLFSLWLVPFFGTYLTLWQAAPLLYILPAALFLACGMCGYRNYQISGR